MGALTVQDLQVVAGDPRVKDLVLAERLGFERPRKIREIIRRNMARLERNGFCPTVGQNHSGGRGRPTREYWLNRRQALTVCLLSETPKAVEVQEQILDVFEAYQDGQLVSANLRHGGAKPSFQPALAAEVSALVARAEELARLVLAHQTVMTPGASPSIGHAVVMAQPRNKQVANLARDPDVHAVVVETHRRMTIDDARAQVVSRCGAARAPSRSALARYWKALDRVYGGRA